MRNKSNIVFFFQAEDGIRYSSVTGVQTCALPIYDVDAAVCSPHQRRLHLIGYGNNASANNFCSEGIRSELRTALICPVPRGHRGARFCVANSYHDALL